MINPCGEIRLGQWEPVVPWVQVALTNMLRVKQGHQPMSVEECETLRKQLEEPMTADQIRSIRNHTLAQQAEQERKEKEADAKRQAEWEAERPVRVDAEAKKILAIVVEEAEKGLSKTVVKVIHHPEVHNFFKLKGFICHTETKRREIEYCENYDAGIWSKTGRFEDEYTLTLEW